MNRSREARQSADDAIGGAGLREMFHAKLEDQHNVVTLDGSGQPSRSSVDLKGYFDTIDHDLLMERIEEKVSDGRVLILLRQMLQQGIFEDGQTWRKSPWN